MTACVNRKHTKKVAAVVTASLVGALSLGAAPVAAVADTGIDMQFLEPEKAFEGADIVSVSFDHSGEPYSWDGDTFVTDYVEDKPVKLNEVKISILGHTGVTSDLTINAQDKDYKVEYFKRGDDGYPTGDAIESDIVDAGEYVAVVTAVGGNYKGGVLYLPFNINAIQLNNIKVNGANPVTYNALAHEFEFYFDKNNDGVAQDSEILYSDDIDVYYIVDGHDTNKTSEVKNAGTYRAVVTGKGNYAGSYELSEDIVVNPLVLDDVTVEGLASTSSTEPENPYCIWIDGVRYEDGSAIMNELKADIDKVTTPEDSVWKENTPYRYKVVSAKGSTDPNIKGENYFIAYKVGYAVDFLYDGDALPASHTVYVNDNGKSDWDFTAVTGKAANGTVGGLEIANGDIQQTVYDADGTDVTATNWQDRPGSYTICIAVIADDGSVGGISFVDVKVYTEAVNADAQAAVFYDVDGDGHDEVVTSVSATFDPAADLKDDITVIVEDANGNRLIEGRDFSVTYYDANGKKVGEVTDAGSYTMKVTSSSYDLSGTTEMPITIGKLDISDAFVGALETKVYDRLITTVEYLPWKADGVNISELNLCYTDANGDPQPLPMDVVKVTITDAEGNKLDKIEDEGVYTISFEARNANAENNYTIPAAITVTCIKDGGLYGDVDPDNAGVNHLIFADVQWDDYYADPISTVAWLKVMNGYSDSALFGADDAITRGQVACVLFNMAQWANIEDETDYTYDNNGGYVTGFDDVKGEMYYAKAIAWAKQAGVVNGYAGTNDFRPDAPVTREEFAAMLSNYAKKYDPDFKAADPSVIDSFDDADGVSVWAEEVVAWAVENGIMGNGGFLNAGGDIIRGDAACMVYNYIQAQ
ncbi:S-layer homology domain-containing protein [Collinsella tanakaei]|nr:S-layer homology domain-containing protein [Collinsella tanakaei]